MNRLLLVVGIALPGLLYAQAVPYGLSVDRDRLQTQQPVKVVVNFEAADRWCGLRVDLGDGDVRDIVVEDFPVTITKQYAAVGRYVLRAQGRSMARGLRSALGCAGAARAVTVMVSDSGSDPVSDPPGSRPDAVSKVEQRQREAQREQDLRDAELAREQLKRDAELARERSKRDQEDRRDSPKRDPDIAVGPAPVPAATPRRPPAPVPNKPRDRTLEMF